MSAADTKAGCSTELLGQCVTNTVRESEHTATVQYNHLWSYAQQAALMAVSDKQAHENCYRLVADPERRAKRIAAHYADLYFKSAQKTRGRVQFHWVALAAFVVKDIVEAYRFTREEVLHREWKDGASVARNSVLADLGSIAMTGDSPYTHAIRTYAALAKGNLWLFMDIFPWLWFFLEFGVNADGSLNKRRLTEALSKRDWATFQKASKSAVEDLPYGPAWMGRLSQRVSTDPVYQKAQEIANSSSVWGDGYSSHLAATRAAHQHCKTQAKSFDNGYRLPGGNYWASFKEGFYVMTAEHSEMIRICNDNEAIKTVEKLRRFYSTDAIAKAYEQLIRQYDTVEKTAKKEAELIAIAEQEQINVLQPLIYEDKKLRETMDLNHRFSRMTGGWISPQYRVIYRASSNNADPDLETTFDPAAGLWNRVTGTEKSLTIAEDRMQFVKSIAQAFNRLMRERPDYMEEQLAQIRKWLSA